MPPHDLPDYSAMPTPELCRLFKAWLGPAGLARLAELDAQARPARGKARISHADGLRKALRACQRHCHALGYESLAPVLEAARTILERLDRGEKVSGPKRAERGHQGGLFG